MAGIRSKPLPNGKVQGWFMDSTGKRIFFTGTHSKPDTLRMAHHLEDQHCQIRLGYREAPKSYEKARARRFLDVVGEYMRWGQCQGGKNARGWCAQTIRGKDIYLKRWHDRLGFETLADVQDCLVRVEAEGRRIWGVGHEKLAQEYVGALHGFFAWAFKRGYLKQHPLDGMTPFKARQKTIRRELTAAEVVKLLKVAPPRRALVYQTMLGTGFRPGELRALRVRHLDVQRGVLALEGDFTKSGQPAAQPLPAALVRLLAAAAAGKGAYEPLLKATTHPDRYFAKDRDKAGIPHQLNGTACIYSLRHTFATLLDRAGASETEMDVLMRHSLKGNINKLHYVHVDPQRLRALVEAVWEAVDCGQAAEVALRTGTDDQPLHDVQLAAGVQRATGVQPFSQVLPAQGDDEYFKSSRPDHFRF